MRSLWHGSKIDMSLAPKRKLSVLGGKRGIKMESLQRGLAEKGGRERDGGLSAISGSLTMTLSNVRIA
ncbi:hypothetical protein Pyn_02122 [Prunus yedoensis var. nudiflora]|uniref:Uncharacterized protein n=1 Tax=Prunus yedoensis var. nudiflora TaxID=2094558 RepID=A0A314Y3C8_PRUYE|nr:hypothetical protein Pyn_02122 [Prunus yedoensis var. nudiflora]